MSNFRFILTLFILLTSAFTSLSQEVSVEKMHFNSNEMDYSPIITSDGIVFVSNRKTKAMSSEYDANNELISNILFSKKTGETFDKPEPFAPEFGTFLNEGPACFNKSENTIYFTKSLEPENKNQNPVLGIFYSEKINEHWSEPLPLNLNSTSFDYDIAHPSLSEDGLTLYFSSNMNGGFGGYDIYMSKFINGWSKPENLGAMINSENNEGYPRITAYNKLYYSSSAFSENRGMDIVYSVLNKSKGWSTPRLMEEPINSKKNDFGICFDTTGMNGYLSSDRNKKSKDDIYKFTLNYPTFEDCRENYEPFLCYLIEDENTKNSNNLPFKYEWHLGDGNIEYGDVIEYCFPGYGSYDVSLHIIDTTTNELYAKISDVYIEIEKMPQPYIQSIDTVFIGEYVQFEATEIEHIDFDIDGIFWDFGGYEKTIGEKASFAFPETGLHRIVLGSEGINNPDSENVCVYKDILVVDDEMLVRMEETDRLKKTGVYEMTEMNKIEVNDIKQSDYLSSRQLGIDTSLYFVQIRESDIQIPLKDVFFSKTEREITERYSDKRYLYSIGEEFDFSDLYLVRNELIDSGYTEILVLEDMKYDFEEETTRKGYFMPDSLRLAINKHINEFANIHFSYNKFDILPESFENLNEIVKTMQSESGFKLNIMAHTDNQGDPDYNFVLSVKRAQSVLDYLTSHGVNSERLLFQGFGELYPLLSENSEEAYSINRRVEFEVVVEEIF